MPADLSSPRQVIDGRLEGAWLAGGSKSAHQGVLLVPDAGEPVPLRRVGGHPFKDPVLEALVGQRVRVIGVLRDSGLLADSVTPLP
jgi:hypothetical protein